MLLRKFTYTMMPPPQDSEAEDEQPIAKTASKSQRGKRKKNKLNS